jgi:hypothetical protein
MVVVSFLDGDLRLLLGYQGPSRRWRTSAFRSGRLWIPAARPYGCCRVGYRHDVPILT